MLLSELRRVVREEVELQKVVSSDEDFVVKTLQTRFDVDSVNYGNPPLEFHKIAKNPEDFIKNWFIDCGLVDEICRSAPANDSETTREDLKALFDNKIEIFTWKDLNRSLVDAMKIERIATMIILSLIFLVHLENAIHL